MDETQMMEFVGQAVADVGALLGGAMVVIGDKLGLYRAMAGAGSPGGTSRAASVSYRCYVKQIIYFADLVKTMHLLIFRMDYQCASIFSGFRPS